MWYVIQTIKGKEQEHTTNIKRNVIADEEKVFLIENERPFRLKGKWLKELKPLFPGYIFVETEDIEDFAKRLRKRYRTLKILAVDGKMVPIRDEEEAYLKSIGGEEHIVRYSEGVRIGDRVEITSGSFAGYTGEIRKLDRHNRRASLCLPLMGREIEVEIGLGIVKSAL